MYTYSLYFANEYTHLLLFSIMYWWWWSMLLRTLFNSLKMASKHNVVFVLGAPGAGKGTQCKKIVEVWKNFLFYFFNLQ